MPLFSRGKSRGSVADLLKAHEKPSAASHPDRLLAHPLFYAFTILVEGALPAPCLWLQSARHSLLARCKLPGLTKHFLADLSLKVCQSLRVGFVIYLAWVGASTFVPLCLCKFVGTWKSRRKQPQHIFTAVWSGSMGRAKKGPSLPKRPRVALSLSLSSGDPPTDGRFNRVEQATIVRHRRLPTTSAMVEISFQWYVYQERPTLNSKIALLYTTSFTSTRPRGIEC